jgi:hypothetical protein
MTLRLPPVASQDATDSERAPLLEPKSQKSEHANVHTHITQKLYVSHFLSTWNSRVFEFGAILYLATIFPGTLVPMSLYALTRGLSAFIFAPAVGSYIDTANRLQVVRTSIGRITCCLMVPFADHVCTNLQSFNGWRLRLRVSACIFWLSKSA